MNQPTIAETLARFPLSRVSEEFHDEMLGCLPPVHMTGVPGFFISEAVTDRIHAHFVAWNGRFYGAYANLADRDGPTGPITAARIEEFDRDNPDPKILDWYPKAS